MERREDMTASGMPASQARAVLPAWHCLGLGMVHAWIFSVLLGQSLIPEASAMPMPILNYWVIIATSIITWLVLALLRRNGLITRRLLISSAAIASAGSVTMAFEPSGFPFAAGSQLFCLGPGMAGLGTSILILGWGEAYGELGIERSSVGTAGSVVMAGVLSIAIRMIPVRAVTVGLIVALPLLSAVMLIRIRAFCGAPGSRLAAFGLELRRWMRSIMAVMAVYGLAFGLLAGLVYGSINIQTKNIIDFETILGALVILLGYLLFPKKTSGGDINYKLVLLMISIGFMLIPLFEAATVAAATIFASVRMLDLMTWALFSSVSFNNDGTAVRIFGLGRAFIYGGVASGLAASFALTAYTDLGDAVIVSVALVMLFLIMLAATLLLRQPSKPLAAPPPTNAKARSEAGAGEYAWVAGLAAEKKLSQRQGDILVLLLQGRNIPYISRRLLLSNGTVKSHVRSMYQSLGVHSRQELIDHCEAWRNASRRH
jgi:DNA-binding CsgD family transcriptional regulator